MLIKFLEMKSIFTPVNIHIFEKSSFFFFIFFKCIGALMWAQVYLLVYSKRIVFIWPSENSKDLLSHDDISLIKPELGAATLIG